MLNRRQVVLEERFRSVMAKNVTCYLEADRLERTGNGEQAALLREKSDRWLKLQRRLGAALDASRAQATVGSGAPLGTDSYARASYEVAGGSYQGTSLDVPKMRSTSVFTRL